MEVLPLTTNEYQAWNEFCLSSDGAWFWHTTDWLEYNIIYRWGRTGISSSFMVVEDSKILAICPLILEEMGGNTSDIYCLSDDKKPVRVIPKYNIWEFGFGGLPTWAPAFSNSLSSKRKEKIINMVFARIDELAHDNGVSRASFALCPLCSFENNYLMKLGYIDISLNTQIIDLSQDLKTIHGAMRKGHDYDIDKGLRDIVVEIYDSGNITELIFEQYCSLHHMDAGWMTRPPETWNMQHEWIKNGQAILLKALFGNDVVGFSYIFIYKNKAYYGSACSDSEYPKLPVHHVLNWKTIEWLKKHGFSHYEIGWQQYTPLPHDFPSKKETAISFFKRGFGGAAVPLFRGEKYYSADYYLKVNLERANRYALYLRERRRKNANSI